MGNSRYDEILQEIDGDRWRTDEADFKAAEPIIRQMLETSDVELSPNFRFIHCRNPILAAQAGDVLAKKIDGVGGKNLLQASAYGEVCARNLYYLETDDPKHLWPHTPLQKEELLRFTNRLRDFIRFCGGAYLHSHFAIIYDRPSLLRHTLQEGHRVLHCEDGPAIAWGRGPDGSYSPDDEFGYALRYLNGVQENERNDWDESVKVKHLPDVPSLDKFLNIIGV